MNKRTFLTLATATCLLPTLALAEGFVDYTPGLIQSELDAGNTVFVDYSAEWCTTCARQERVISALRDANPAYGEAMTFIKVDWDTYARDDVTTYSIQCSVVFVVWCIRPRIFAFRGRAFAFPQSAATTSDNNGPN